MQQAANLTHGTRALVHILAGVCAAITTGPAKRHATGAKNPLTTDDAARVKTMIALSHR
jgi:hypothetical protein